MKNSFKHIILICLAGFVLLFTACDKDKIFEQSKTIDKDTWLSNDFIRFNVNIPDNTIPVNYYLIVRNTTDYKYSNIFFFVRTKLPDGTMLTDTINCVLAYPDGKWVGKGIGKYREVTQLLIPNSLFPQKGEYVFEFEQAMREDKLKGINAIGIRIEESNIKE